MYFITPAYAQAPGADPLTSMLVPLALMIPIFYFLVIRPNQQREKQRREMISAVPSQWPRFIAPFRLRSCIP